MSTPRCGRCPKCKRGFIWKAHKSFRLGDGSAVCPVDGKSLRQTNVHSLKHDPVYTLDGSQYPDDYYRGEGLYGQPRKFQLAPTKLRATDGMPAIFAKRRKAAGL